MVRYSSYLNTISIIIMLLVVHLSIARSKLLTTIKNRKADIYNSRHETEFIQMLSNTQLSTEMETKVKLFMTDPNAISKGLSTCLSTLFDHAVPDTCKLSGITEPLHCKPGHEIPNGKGDVCVPSNLMSRG